MGKPTPQNVTKALERLGRSATAGQAELLALYLGLLEKWNRKMNLVGPDRWADMLEILVVDSLYLAEFIAGLPLEEKPLCLDLGAGAGLPGIPLRMFWHEGEYWLVEVRQKRAGFMRTALTHLKLDGTYVFNGKAEDALERLTELGHGTTANLILSKAFMPWEKLLDFTRPMLKAGEHPGILVILSNDPPPEHNLPDGWQLVTAASYPVVGKKHYFWALSPSK